MSDFPYDIARKFLDAQVLARVRMVEASAAQDAARKATGALHELTPTYNAAMASYARSMLAEHAPDCCDAGKVWNNADPTSGMWVPCAVHGEGVA